MNLNALVPVSLDETPTQPSEEAEEFLIAFFERILDPGAFPSDATRDPRELARNLLDYIDADDVALGGRSEDDYYLNQAAPYTAANRPLLSVDEVAMIEGFDTEMAERLRPYFTVYPLLGETGVKRQYGPAPRTRSDLLRQQRKYAARRRVIGGRSSPRAGCW